MTTFVYNRLALILKSKGILRVHPDKLMELGIGPRCFQAVIENKRELTLAQAFAMSQWLGMRMEEIFYTEQNLHFKINTHELFQKHSHN